MAKKNIKFGIVTLTEINGNFEYTHKQLIERDADCNLNEEAEEVAKGYFCDATEEDGKYWDDCMERTVHSDGCIEVTPEEFKILSKFI